MTRPRGSLNRVTKDLRVVLDRLEKAEVLRPARWFERLQELAFADGPDRVPALRLLLAYRFGAPPSKLEVTHSPSESAEQLLVKIARSEQHRANLEAVEARRRLSAAVTVEPEP